MSQMTQPAATARDRILDTASRLFYAHGFNAVGVDTIVAESGVAKMTLYRHFPSKEDLIVAYLERANQQFWGWFERAIAGEADPERKLVALFQGVAKLTNTPQCLGCTFQAAAAEFPTLDHRAHQVALAHKQAVRARLEELAAQARLRAPESLATQLLMLMDGAWVAARMFGPDNPAKSVAQAAEALIAAHR